MTALRALLYFFCQLVTTPVYVMLMTITAPFWKAGPRYFSGA